MKTQQTNQVIYLITIMVLCSAWLIVGCKNNNSENNFSTEQAIAYQDSLRQDSILKITAIQEWNSFKTSTETVLANNQERIDELRIKIKKWNTPNIDKLRQKKIDKIQSENQQIRERLVELEIKKNKVLLSNKIETIKRQLKSIEAELNEIS